MKTFIEQKAELRHEIEELEREQNSVLNNIARLEDRVDLLSEKIKTKRELLDVIGVEVKL